VETFADYTQQKTVTSKKLVDAPYHSTICQNCNSVCHDHCGLQEVDHTDPNHFKGCAAMAGSENCSVCEGKCSHTVHYHARKTMTEETQTIEDVLQDIKAKYDLAMQGKNDAEAKVTNVADASALVENAIEAQRQKLFDYCQAIKKLCSGFNLVDELDILIQELETDAKQLTSFNAKKTANDYINSLKALCEQLTKEQRRSGSNTKPNATFSKNQTKSSSSSSGAIENTNTKKATSPPKQKTNNRDSKINDTDDIVQKLVTMGFSDVDKNIEVLSQTNGDIEEAIEILSNN